MRLSSYLQVRKETATAFGQRLPRPRPAATVYRWVAGERLPGRDDMPQIFAATGGQVTPNDFYDLPPLPEGGAAEPEASQEAA